MHKILLSIALLFAGITVQAPSPTIYISDSGSGTACTLSDPCSLSTGMSNLDAGETLSIVGALTKAVTLSKSGTAAAHITLTGDAIAAPATVQQALLVSGSYVDVVGLDISGGDQFGVRVKGSYVRVIDTDVHDSVWENRSGDACIGGSGGWGRGLTFALTADHAEVSGGRVYRNCGEGIAFTQNEYSYLHDVEVFDNFSRNVYIGNAAYVTVENISSYYTGDAGFYRNGNPGRCIGLAIETTNYSTVGNIMHDATVRGNRLSDCLGINFYQEVSGQTPSDVLVENNVFTRVAAPWVDIPGTNIVVQGNTSGEATTPTPTVFSSPTPTRTDTPTTTPSPTYTPTFTPSPTPTPDACAGGVRIFEDAEYIFCAFRKEP